MVIPSPEFKSVSISIPGYNHPVTPQVLRFCPRGMEFIIAEKIPPFQILELELSMPVPDSLCSRFVCSGAVVQCEAVPNTETFQVSLLFLDLPECAKKHIASGQ